MVNPLCHCGSCGRPEYLTAGRGGRGMNAMEHTEADRLLGAATRHSVPMTVDVRSMDADVQEHPEGS